MSKYACVFAALMVGCANQVSPPEASPSDAFYTWVDDRGQLHSEPRKKSSTQVIPRAETPSADVILNPADYTPVEVVDARLAQKRLYAWTDETGANHMEERDKPTPAQVAPAMPSSVTASENPYPVTCCISLSLQDKLLLSDLKSRTLSLEDFYRSDEFFEHGVIIVELDSVADALRVQSFIQSDRVAVPDILLLDERYQILHYLQAPLSHFVAETWVKLGYLQGLIGSDFLKDVHYVVITPSAKAGVLPLDDKDVKITDFGYVTIFPDAPAL